MKTTFGFDNKNRIWFLKTVCGVFRRNLSNKRLSYGFQIWFMHQNPHVGFQTQIRILKHTFDFRLENKFVFHNTHVCFKKQIRFLKSVFVFSTRNKFGYQVTHVCFKKQIRVLKTVFVFYTQIKSYLTFVKFI